MVDPIDPYNVRHVPSPATLVRLQTKEGKKSLMLCYSWNDLDERLQRYVAMWDRTFPLNTIHVVSKEPVE